VESYRNQSDQAIAEALVPCRPFSWILIILAKKATPFAHSFLRALTNDTGSRASSVRAGNCMTSSLRLNIWPAVEQDKTRLLQLLYIDNNYRRQRTMLEGLTVPSFCLGPFYFKFPANICWCCIRICIRSGGLGGTSTRLRERLSSRPFFCLAPLSCPNLSNMTNTAKVLRHVESTTNDRISI
jgi:hypothetical protein